MAVEAMNNKRASSGSLTDGISVLLLDIEGTTTPISFVKDVLFGFVRENLNTYLEEYWEETECKEDIKRIIQQNEEDKKENLDGFVEIDKARDKETTLPSVISYIKWLMKIDRKVTPLKQLQGHMWRTAYATGKIKGKVFDDVPQAMKEWTSDPDKKIYIYSSGSIEAQKLLFQYTESGDLTKYLSGYFDTTTGHKREEESYRKIAKQIELSPAKILFLTDIPQEAAAAFKVGMKTTLLTRKGNAPLSEEEQKSYSIIDTFDKLFSNNEKSDDEPAAKKSTKDDS